MDIGFRASAVAVGAAVFNARVAAAANGVLGPVEFAEADARSPLRAVIGMAGNRDPDLARLYPSMIMRETNRRQGTATELSAETVEALRAAAFREGARLELLTARQHIEQAAMLCAAADRIRYLTPQLHADMASELRWPGEGPLDSGIDVRSLELDAGDLLTLDILRRPEVMSMLADWDAGAALGADTRARIAASSGLAVVVAKGRSLTDYALGGSAAEAVWIAAQERRLAIQPISPVFLYAHDDDELRELSPAHAAALRDLQSDFRQLTRTAPGEAQVLVLRLTDAPPASVRSRRRRLENARPPLP
jgi:hypothetical protein